MILIIGMVHHMKRILALISITIAATACGTSSAQPDAQKDVISVAASFYPIEEIVRRVGGTHVSVVVLTPAGQLACRRNSVF